MLSLSPPLSPPQAKEIDEKQLIDQHYYAIASKATLLKPIELNVPAEKFEAQFGIKWKDANEQGKCYNAIDACEKLGIDAEGTSTIVRSWCSLPATACDCLCVGYSNVSGGKGGGGALLHIF